MPLTFCKHTAPLHRVSSATPCIANTCCRQLYNRLPLQSVYNFLHKSHCAGQNRRKRPVCAYSKYDQGTTNPQPSYSSPIPTNLRSAVHSVSFNQQLLIVLCIPAAALGVPFALSHPLFCIVLPLVAYYTPGLQEVVKPLLAALLQLILGGLRPSRSSRFEAFPWQQANQPPYASPPIDIEYQALPGEIPDAAYSQSQSTASTRPEYTRSEQASTSYESAQPYNAGRQRVPLQRQTSSEPADAMQQRRRVSITPVQRQSRRNGRIVRQAAPGQVGVNIGPDTSAITEPNSNLVRVLLGVFPFLRHWGGFL